MPEGPNGRRAVGVLEAAVQPAHPDDALAALTGTARWPGAAIIWARDDGGRIRLVGRR